MAKGIGLDGNDLGKLARKGNGDPGRSANPGVVGPAKLAADRDGNRLFPAIEGELVGRNQPVLVADMILDVVVTTPCHDEKSKKG